jgi:hypothetical protein
MVLYPARFFFEDQTQGTNEKLESRIKYHKMGDSMTSLWSIVSLPGEAQLPGTWQTV